MRWNLFLKRARVFYLASISFSLHRFRFGMEFVGCIGGQALTELARFFALWHYLRVALSGDFLFPLFGRDEG